MQSGEFVSKLNQHLVFNKTTGSEAEHGISPRKGIDSDPVTKLDILN